MYLSIGMPLEEPTELTTSASCRSALPRNFHSIRKLRNLLKVLMIQKIDPLVNGRGGTLGNFLIRLVTCQVVISSKLLKV